MALANIREIRARRLVQNSARLGSRLLDQLSSLSSQRRKLTVRGAGLMAGIEVQHANGAPATADVFSIVKGMLERGFIMLPEGEHGSVLSFTPPLTVTTALLDDAVENVAQLLGAL
jgi:4-aminobutyrate aminotransferase/(S)-3-amino-2-methylpropionate transaminase